MLITFIIAALIVLYWNSLFKSSSHQLWIRFWGFRIIPKLLLELAKIETNRDITWKDLSKAEAERLRKFYKRFEDVASARLTFLYSQNLVHVEMESRNFFHPLDKNLYELVKEELGDISDTERLSYVLYRRPGRWRKTARLIGYLEKEDGAETSKSKTEILFEFPEALVDRSFFTKNLEYRFNLKQFSDIVGDPLHKDIIGEEEALWVFHSYDQEHSNGADFNFLIYS